MVRKLTYYRQSRTPHSEQYELVEGESRVGHVDLHYGQTQVYGTLVLDHEMSEEEVSQVIQQIDDDLVESAEVQRDDFVVRAYVGREVGIGLYSDEVVQDALGVESEDGFEGDFDA